MESESDDNGKPKLSKVKRLVKKITDDTKSDSIFSDHEGYVSNKDVSDDDESIQSLITKMKPDLDDADSNDKSDEQEIYASAHDNDYDSEEQTNKNSDVDNEESENNLVEEKEDIEAAENNDDGDNDEYRTFRRSFTTIRRTRTWRRQTNNTEPEDMSGEEEYDDSIKKYDNDSARKFKSKRQPYYSDDTEPNDSLDEQDDALEVVEDEINNKEDSILHGDEIIEGEPNDNLDEQNDTLDSSLDEDDPMYHKARKANTHTGDINPEVVESYWEEDITIEDKYDDSESTLNIGLENVDKEAPSEEGGPETIQEEHDDEITNINHSTRTFKAKMHQFNENKDSHQEQENVSENNNNADSTTVKEDKNLPTEENLYSFIFKDPMEDLKALTGRIVKDARMFQEPSKEMRPLPDTPPPESDKYYEDENEMPEPSFEPAAHVHEEPKEPQDLEAQNLQPKEEEEVQSESEEKVQEEASQLEESVLRINTNALGKASQTYELERFEKNALIIFHQEWIPGYERRKGTIKDAKDLASTFEKFGFEISVHVDQTKDEIFRKLEEFATTDFSDYGCVAVAIMTHGFQGHLQAKDRKYRETHIINYFKSHSNPTLVTKPKVIIIQACRGKKITPAVPVNQAMSPLGKIAKDHDEHEQYTLPTESDILVLHSTYAGNPSHRDETYGTWFIQTLCKKIEDLAHVDDLESIFTEVQREVAIDKEHKEWNIDTKKDEIGKQMPVKMSTLIRKLFFSYKDFARHNPEMQSQINQDMVTKAAVKRDSNFSGISSSDNFTPCACFLEKFLYLTDCMRYFVEDNPEDETATSFLEIAESFGDGTEFNKTKEKFSRAIINHLKVNAEKCEFYKYLYL